MYSLPFHNKVPETPLNKVNTSWLDENNVELYLKRDDLIDLRISGNKWRKLYGYLKEFQKGDYKEVITWGSAWSNHLHACSALVSAGIKVTAILPEDKYLDQIPSLIESRKSGLVIEVVSRSEFRARNQLMEERAEKETEVLFIPEGGSGPLAHEGIQAMVNECLEQTSRPDYWLCAAGVGGQMVSMMSALSIHDCVIGVECVKGAKISNYVKERYEEDKMADYQVWQGHQGGLGRWSADMPGFLEEWNRETSIQLDPLYTAKMFYTLKQQVVEGHISNATILAVHSGGLIAWKNKEFKDSLL